MRFALALALALALIPRFAAADKLTLDQVIAKAIANPRVAMAEQDEQAAAAQVDEADYARLPHLKGTAFGTISPKITCDDPNCTSTSPHNFAFDFDGLFGGAELDLTQPLYTFGKIDHARKAARAGLAAEHALADEAAGDAASDAARAYWGLKLARTLGDMLDDGIDEIQKAKADFDSKHDATIQDRQRVAVLLATAKAQRADAELAEVDALAGLRAITAQPDADIDDSELAPVERPLPPKLDVDARPQQIAAKAGATAADELAAASFSNYFPDIALVGTALVAAAQGAQDPPSAYANNPYNRAGAGLAVGLSWTIEPWNVKARTDRARANARKSRAQSDLAAIGARYDGDSALGEAKAAHDKLAASAEGEKAARTWLAAVLQAQAIGTAEARDLADAYIAWFQMHAQWAQAVVAWNVAVVRLGRATGEFRAGGSRLK
ncbi:MAG TPA: TolC family protein [Kofleriaceae bacterium]|jgi:outer membrane protein TolC